ncbi:MAG: HNH endonuclease [Alphaproteobacteria bacterium]
MVTDAYRRQCSVTGERALPVLDAAHIRPYANGGDHAVQNGLLLRSDVHTLFDRGYVTVTPAYRLEVSKRIKDEFDNGKHYYAFHGKELILPRDHLQMPAKHELEWHNNNTFLG